MADNYNYTPVRKIKGTELYTGTWYTIDSKSTGRLSWTNYPVNTGNHLQLASGCLTADYDIGGKNYEDAQWMLVPAKGKSDRYKLVSKTLPNSIITYEGDSKNGKYVVAIPDKGNHPDYQENGQFQDEALWWFEKQEDGYHNISNHKFPETGIMTWTDAGYSSGCNYVQIYVTGSSASYKTSANYLWHFVQVPDQTKLIPGTTLSLGKWYTVDLKSTGRLCWTLAKEVNGHHVQVAYGSHAPDYEEGGKNYFDAQWTFVPAEETPDRYLLANRGKPDAVITFEGASAHGHYVVAIPDKANDADYQKGGNLRDEALWQLIKEPGDDYYHLINHKLPVSGILTYADYNVDSGRRYCQIYNTGNAESSLHFQNYMWRFKEVDTVDEDLGRQYSSGQEIIYVIDPPTHIYL